VWPSMALVGCLNASRLLYSPLPILRFRILSEPGILVALGSLLREDLLLDKGKPVVRQGRKVTGQAHRCLTAGLPTGGVFGCRREHGGLPARRSQCQALGPPSLTLQSASSCAE